MVTFLAAIMFERLIDRRAVRLSHRLDPGPEASA
jgi:hypothetical protein